MKEFNLKVAEAIQDDVNKGIIRIDSNLMRQISVRPGDIVKITGEKDTVAIADRAYPGDIGLNIIRMDGIIRRNAKTAIGESVKVEKAVVKEAKKVIISPAKEGVMIRAPPNIFKQGLLGRAVKKGDIVSLGGTRSRRTTMSQSPFFEDIFNMLDENMLGFGFGDLKFIIADTSPKDAVIITELTEVQFNPEAAKVTETEDVPDVTYEDIGGLDEEIKKVREMVELPLRHPEIFERLGIEPPKGVLLHGPPGTGKTLLAKAVANETSSEFITINGPEIMSKYYGQSEENLRKKFEDAQKNAPAIIFIDEVDAIAIKREESKGEVERRVVAQLLALMDGLQSRGKVVVIAASNIPHALDPALRRPGRFDREIEIGVPGKEGRLNVLKIHTRNMPLAKNVNLKKIADITHGFVGADLESLAKESAMIVLRRLLPDLKYEEDETIPNEVLEKLIITQKEFIEALKIVRPSAMREVLVEVPNLKWDDIGGLESVKQELIEAVEWPLKHPDAFKKLGVSPPRGVLLYGAPGTGKTLLAKAVANESEANFILVKGPELLSKWVGESEKAVRKVFQKARQASPTVIFFDEIDALAPRRGASSDSNVSERVVNQLLTEMDGLEEMNDVVFVAATNQPEMVDTALLRPGRFDRLILVDVPDEVSRKHIFDVHTKEIPINLDKEEMKGIDKMVSKDIVQHSENMLSKMASDKAINGKIPKKEKKKIDTKEISDREKFLWYLAKKTHGYSGADIEGVCQEAAVLALRKEIRSKAVSIEDFDDAIKKVKPSVTKEVEDYYKDLGDSIKSARGKKALEEKPSYMG